MPIVREIRGRKSLSSTGTTANRPLPSIMGSTCLAIPNLKGHLASIFATRHVKGHQIKGGEPYKEDGKGDYIPSSNDAELREVMASFREKLDIMWRSNGNDILASHKETLGSFGKEIVVSFKSRRACSSCLAGLPEYPLSCGHVFCTACIREVGECHGVCFYAFGSCPLEQKPFGEPWLVSVKPPEAGVRILSLDGGGPFGVIELEILKKIEDELGEVPLHAFFDLIVGTR